LPPEPLFVLKYIRHRLGGFHLSFEIVDDEMAYTLPFFGSRLSLARCLFLAPPGAPSH
jgi:hypothetical protein